MRCRKEAFLVFVLHLAFPCALLAQIDRVPIAIVGDRAPDGNGVFRAFGEAVINDQGVTAFTAALIGTTGGTTDDAGLYASDGAVLTQIVRKGDLLPDGTGRFSGFSQPAINDDGHIAFIGLIAKDDGAFRAGIFVGSATDPGPIRQIVRMYNATPDGADLYGYTPNQSPFAPPAFNNSGQLVFFSYLVDTGGRQSGAGIYSSDGTTITQIVRSGQPVPGTNLLFAAPSLVPVVSDDGLIVFRANFITMAGVDAGDGILLSDGETLSVVVRSGLPTPDGTGTYGPREAKIPALNDSSGLVFSMPVFGATGRFESIYRRTDNGVVEIRRLTSGGVGPLDQNAAGQVSFLSVPTGGSGSISRIDEDGSGLVVLVTAGQPAPDQNGTLSLRTGTQASVPTINDAGQVAFGSFVSGSSVSGDAGLFVYDDAAGLVQIARLGDAFLGSTVTGLSFIGGSPQNAYSGFNNSGQMAYFFQLQDGRGGIAVANGLDQLPIATPTASASPTATQTPPLASTATSTPSSTRSPSPSPTMPTPCIGDCDGSRSVTVNELIAMVNIALGTATTSACPGGIPAGVSVDVSLLVRAVNNALAGCA